MKWTLFSGTVLTAMLSMGSVGHAAEFFTIIGPDGRPMVVQRKSAETAEPVRVPVSEKKTVAEVTGVTEAKKSESAEPVIKKQPDPSGVRSESRASEKVTVKTESVIKTQKAATLQPHATDRTDSGAVLPAKTVSLPQTPVAVVQKDDKASTSVKKQDGFSELDGENYVKSEYLEDKEFNLEGKKRFYAMPEGIIDTRNGGGSRLQVVEREKGVGQSVLKSLFNQQKKTQDDKPVVLSTDYYRVPGPEAVDSLGQQCFTDKKVSKAKTLKPDGDVNVWPRAPLKEHFDYEVIRLEGAVRNVQINSYASTQQNPVFYWPFVVFLDQKGCVLEGAGGFRNDNSAASMLRHEVVQGLIQLPEKTQYILLTPLASAIDMENRTLTNHGQLKLVAIR